VADAATFRKLALALPQVEEGSHHGNADFRSAGRIFASLHANGSTAMVRLAPGRQQQLLATATPGLAPANGAWGRQGCTLITLPTVRETLLQSLLTDAWEHLHTRPS
jgi:hypothetical protein